MSKASLTALRDEAWKLRLRQRIAEAEDCYFRLRDLLKLGRTQLLPTTAAMAALSDEEQAVAMDTVLLGGSLARFHSRLEKGVAALAWVEDLARTREDGESFYLYLERGIRAHIDGDLEAALRAFTRSRDRASQPWQECIGLVNVLFGMELLGIAGQATLARLNHVSKGLAAEDQIPAISRQLALFNARAAFHRGEAQKALEGPKAGDGVDQAAFFRLWLRSLPYLAAHKAVTDEELEGALVAPTGVYEADYLMRTLRGVLHPSDLDHVIPYDAADRIYLWTWRWLAAPDRTPASAILRVIEALAPWEKERQLTYDDRQIIGNALLWLGLFGCEPLSAMQLVLTRLDAGSSRIATVYAFERLLIEWAYAVRDGDMRAREERAAALRAHHFFGHADFLLADLVFDESSQAPLALAGLAHALRDLAREASAGEAQLTVNVLQALVLPKRASQAEADCEREAPIVSVPMVRALALLKEKGVVTCGEFLARAFGIGNFNPVVHERKIFNLLARLKTVLPAGLSLRVKSGFIVCAGDWNQVRVIGVGLHASQLAEGEAWRRLIDLARPVSRPSSGRDASVSAGPLEDEQQPAPVTVRPRITGKGVYTRSQLERWCGRPRSTVNRLLSDLVRDGLIVRTGRARATSYQIIDPDLVVRRLGG